MSKWVLNQSSAALDYPTLGFRANPGDILDATAAPDGRWSLNGNQAAAETVARYTIGMVDPNYVEPGDGHVLVWSDTANTYVPTAPSTFIAEPATDAALKASIAQLKVWARIPDLLIVGAVTRDTNGAATSASVVWPDGKPGTYTATVLSTAFPGAVDAYAITYGSPVTKTYTQPTITRDATTGAATNVPAITVA